ncbi:unnamed protein product, partial [Brassica rapa subsp. trilocularis]
DCFVNVYRLLTFRHLVTAGSMFSVGGFDVIPFLLLFGEENLRIQIKGVKALETPGASKDLHRLERHLQWLTPNTGSVEKRVVPLPHLPSMVVLSKLNPSHYLNLIATISIHPSIIEGSPASTEQEPTQTDSVITSTETPIDDEKTPVQRRFANTDNSNCGDLGLTKYNRIPFFCFKALFYPSIML